MKLAATVVNMDCEPMARESMEYLVKNTSKDSFVFLTDNGSTTAPSPVFNYQMFRIPQNDGVNLVWYKMKEFLEAMEIDILVVGHADFFILEKDWDKKVIKAFEEDEKLVLASFVGSPGVGTNGGRTHGVFLNFIGGTYRNGGGSSYKHHGSYINEPVPAGCFDHCVMIYRVSAFDTIKSWWPSPPPMHFEDRILPAAANYYGYHCVILNVDCDHISGAKSTGMSNYFNAVKRWLDANNLPHPEDGNYDRSAYLEAERQFLSKWRDEVGLIPFNVDKNYTVLTKANLP